MTLVLIFSFYAFGVAFFIRSTKELGYSVSYKSIANPTNVLKYDVFKVFTSRLTGYDGLIVGKMINEDENIQFYKDQFSLKVLFTNIGSNLIPGADLTGFDYGFGRKIGIYFNNLPETLEHASALGLFGFLRMFGYWTGAFLCAFIHLLNGLIIGLILRYSKDFELLISIITITILQLSATVMSGNLDATFSSQILIYIKLMFYGLLTFIAHHILRRLNIYRIMKI